MASVSNRTTSPCRIAGMRPKGCSARCFSDFISAKSVMPFVVNSYSTPFSSQAIRAARTQLEMSKPMISSAAIAEPPDFRPPFSNLVPVFLRTKYVQEHILSWGYPWWSTQRDEERGDAVHAGAQG